MTSSLPPVPLHQCPSPSPMAPIPSLGPLFPCHLCDPKRYDAQPSSVPSDPSCLRMTLGGLPSPHPPTVSLSVLIRLQVENQSSSFRLLRICKTWNRHLLNRSCSTLGFGLRGLSAAGSRNVRAGKGLGDTLPTPPFHRDTQELREVKGLAQGHTACQWLGQRPLTAPQVPVPTPPPPVSKEIEPLKV